MGLGLGFGSGLGLGGGGTYFHTHSCKVGLSGMCFNEGRRDIRFRVRVKAKV